MSDLMEKMAMIMLNQGKQIDGQTNQISLMRSKLDGFDHDFAVGKQDEVGVHDDHNCMPELFSLRKSPYY